MNPKNTPENADGWFWSRAIRQGDCLIWQGCKDKDGYGRVRIEGKNRTTGQAAFYLKTGAFPEGEACHTCDNPSCVEPSHVYDASHAHNMGDMAQKGRTGVRRGFDNHATKLSDEDLREIADRRNSGEKPSDVAAMFGIRREVVYLIASGKYARKF